MAERRTPEQAAALNSARIMVNGQLSGLAMLIGQVEAAGMDSSNLTQMLNDLEGLKPAWDAEIAEDRKPPEPPPEDPNAPPEETPAVSAAPAAADADVDDSPEPEPEPEPVKP